MRASTVRSKLAVYGVYSIKLPKERGARLLVRLPSDIHVLEREGGEGLEWVEATPQQLAVVKKHMVGYSLTMQAL